MPPNRYRGPPMTLANMRAFILVVALLLDPTAVLLLLASSRRLFPGG